MPADRIFVGLAKVLAVGLMLVWSLFPIAFVVSSSFKLGRDIFAVPPKLVFEPTLQHYAVLWTKWGDFFQGLVNSFIVTAGATLLTVACSVMAGFIYSRHRSSFMTGSVVFLVVVRLIPPIVVTLPLFPVLNWLNLNDTHFALVLLYATFFVSLGTILMRTFIDQVPRELDEAAIIDGAGQARILTQVIIPLVLPGMLAVATFVVVYAWNEFLFAFVFTATRAKTAPIVISEMIGSIDGVDWGVLFSAATVQLLPVLVFVMFTHRFLVAGLTAGATKG